jgi:hypothetical protein
MAKLTLSSWASIAEIVSAIAVVLSLIYVATELRGNTRAVEAATLVEVNKIAREHLLLVWSNQEANRISLVGDEDLSQLSPEERQRYYWNVRSFWLGMQTVFRQHDLGNGSHSAVCPCGGGLSVVSAATTLITATPAKRRMLDAAAAWSHLAVILESTADECQN